MQHWSDQETPADLRARADHLETRLRVEAGQALALRAAMEPWYVKWGYPPKSEREASHGQIIPVAEYADTMLNLVKWDLKLPEEAIAERTAIERAVLGT